MRPASLASSLALSGSLLLSQALYCSLNLLTESRLAHRAIAQLAAALLRCMNFCWSGTNLFILVTKDIRHACILWLFALGRLWLLFWFVEKQNYLVWKSVKSKSLSLKKAWRFHQDPSHLSMCAGQIHLTWAWTWRDLWEQFYKPHNAWEGGELC